MGKRSKLTTPIGSRESQSIEFRLENPRIPKEEEQILYQNLFQKNLKLNFAHQTSSHAHVHKKLCLLASSGRQLYCTDTRHYRQNMHHIIRHCTPATSASLGTCRMRVQCLNDRVVQGGGQEAPMYLPLHCRRKSKRRWISDTAVGIMR